MYEKLRDLIRWLKSHLGNISWKEAMEIINAIVALGTPPSFTDKDHFRNWLERLGQISEDIAEKTETLLDDKLVDLCQIVVEDDAIWDLVYSLLIQMFGNDKVDDAILQEASDNLKDFNPLVLLGVLKAIVDIVRLLRDEEPQP